MISTSDRRIILSGVLLSAACLGYFFLLDHGLFSSAQFSRIFRFLLTVYDLRAAWLGFGVCCLAALWNRSAPLLRLVEFLGKHPHAISLACVAAISLGALAVYHDYPLSMDEYAAVFQAKIFATGHLFAQLPGNLIDWLVVSGFNGSFLDGSSATGRVIGHYWPGFALLLAPFEFLNIPWLCNASLAGLAIFLIYWITREITGDLRAAGWAILFTLVSGAFVGDAVSFYSMQAHLTANLAFVALLLKPTTYRALGAGLVGSLALILHNPFPHAVFAAPWIVAMVAQPEQRRYCMPLILGYLPGLGLGLAWLVFRSDIASGVHGAALSGFADSVFMWPNATTMNMRAAALVKMWVWALPCLFVFALLGCLRFRGNPHVLLMTQSAVLTFLAYLFVRFDQGHGWGYRYFHPAWGVVPILAGCAMAHRSDTRLVSFAGALAILNLALVVPFQMYQINEVISAHLAQLPAAIRPGNNVYFIHPRGGFYVADMVQMDPGLRDRDLFLVSHGAELDAQLIRQNWPGAVKITAAAAADQWYLGLHDQRVPIPGSRGRAQFVFAPATVP